MITNIIMAIYGATTICCLREYFRVMRTLEKKIGYEKQSIITIVYNNMNSILKCFVPVLHFIILISLWHLGNE